MARSQEPALADPGAVRDVIESLAEGTAAHVADVRGRVPGARLLLQVDEPSLPAVLAGDVPSASGLNRVRAVDGPDAETGLLRVVSAAQVPTVVHCCGMSAPVGIIRGAGADGAGIDLSQLRRGEEEVLAAAAEAGLGLFVGAVPATPGAAAPAAAPAGQPRANGRAADPNSPQRNRPGGLPDARATAERVVELWRRMGWPAARQPGAMAVAAQVVITPGCGLAGAPPEYARAALACCREAARMLPERIEEEAP